MKIPTYFDMQKLQRASANDSALMLKLLENFVLKKLPKTKYDLKDHINLSGGSSFLIHPKRLFASKVDVNYKVQYLILASKRDPLYYAEYGITYLDLSFWPDVLVDKLKGNPLLEIADNKIHFLLDN